MPKAMWGGRFDKETNVLVNDFNSSISFDSRMYKQDIRGSIAHAAMLAKQGIISQKDCDSIHSGLRQIEFMLTSGEINFDPAAEDIHMFIESKLTELIGDAGKRLHTGRSRNDQVAMDLKLFLRDEILSITQLVRNLCNVLLDISQANLDTIMPGYTHMQRAQPITLAHHLMAYVQMLLRDISRLSDCAERMDYSPLGSGALAATTYPLDRCMTAADTGFSAITDNSIDGVSDRDFVIELAADLSIIMVHLSRFSEEIILWSSAEFGFAEPDDAYSTGSSIMPQKKNPDVAELTRGKSGRVFGSLITILTVMKGLPLAYNKDMQEDKEAIFDAIDTVQISLQVFTEMVRTMTFNKSQMRLAAEGGFTNATDLADYLVRKDMAFREAHEVSGKLVKYCIVNGKTLSDLSIQEFKDFSSIITNDIYESISLERCVSERKIPGGPAPDTVRSSIERARNILERA